MPDLGVSFTRWRDPVSDPPMGPVGSRVLACRNLGKDTVSESSAFVAYSPSDYPTWADLPHPASAVSLEDIERVLAGALAYAITTLAGHEKGERMEAAVARIRAALGGDEP